MEDAAESSKKLVSGLYIFYKYFINKGSDKDSV